MKLRVNGNSMWPLLKNGDTIVLSEIASIQNGDIITVRNPYNRILTHRVIDDKKLITKGDNNVFPEKPLIGKSFELLGVVDYVSQKGRDVNINKYNAIFYYYSSFETKMYAWIKNIIPANKFIYGIKSLVYPIFICLLRVRYGWNN